MKSKNQLMSVLALFFFTGLLIWVNDIFRLDTIRNAEAQTIEPSKSPTPQIIAEKDFNSRLEIRGTRFHKEFGDVIKENKKDWKLEREVKKGGVMDYFALTLKKNVIEVNIDEHETVEQAKRYLEKLRDPTYIISSIYVPTKPLSGYGDEAVIRDYDLNDSDTEIIIRKDNFIIYLEVTGDEKTAYQLAKHLLKVLELKFDKKQ